MTLPTICFLLIFVLAIGLVVWGGFFANRSIVVLAVGLVLTGIGGLGAWYSLMESDSIAWCLGYATVAVSAAGLSIANLLRHPNPAAQ